MPSYQYRCSPCNYSETRFNVRIERADKQKCERCHALLTRMVSEANFKLSGDGWTPKHYGDKS
jgi:putative FmdB family regulatory protein